MPHAHARPKAIDNIRFIELHGEAIIYAPHSSTGHYLNRTALFVWKFCDGDHSVAEIVTKLLETFDHTPERYHIEADIQAILTQFKQARLLNCADDTH